MVVRTVERTKERSGWRIRDTLRVIGIKRSTYYSWINREGTERKKVNTNPFTTLPEEREEVIDYALKHPNLRHRELAWRMVDENVVCLSPSTVYRILSEEDLVKRWEKPQPREKEEKEKPDSPNQRWQSDISYVKVQRRNYYMISFIDEYSRYIVHWKLMTSMDGSSVSLAAQESLEKLPESVRPIIQTDNGSGYISHEFKTVLKQFGVGHHKIHPHCPEENGIVERSHRTILSPLDEVELDNYYQAKDEIERIVYWYNEERLHSALNYLRPADYHYGEPEKLLEERRLKIKEARQKRKEENKRRNQLILSLTRVRENDKNYEIKYENHILLETAKSPI